MRTSVVSAIAGFALSFLPMGALVVTAYAPHLFKPAAGPPPADNASAMFADMATIRENARIDAANSVPLMKWLGLSGDPTGLGGFVGASGLAGALALSPDFRAIDGVTMAVADIRHHAPVIAFGFADDDRQWPTEFAALTLPNGLAGAGSSDGPAPTVPPPATPPPSPDNPPPPTVPPGGGPIVDPSPPAGVPEPATWGLQIVGFGLIGLALRQRRSAGLMRRRRTRAGVDGDTLTG